MALIKHITRQLEEMESLATRTENKKQYPVGTKQMST